MKQDDFSCPSVTSSDSCVPVDGLRFMFGIGAPHPSNELGQEGQLRLWTGNDPPILFPIGYTVSGFFILLITEPADDFGSIYLRTFESQILKTENKSHYLAEGIDEFFGLLREQPTEAQ